MSERHYVPCIVTGNAIAVSKEKKTPSVRIALKTTDDQPRTLYADLWLTDNAFEATLKTLEETFGWQGEKLSELNEPILRDLTCDAVCEWEEIQTESGPKWKERVVFLNRIGGGGGVKKLDPADVHKVVSKLDGLLAQARQNRGAKVPPPPPRRTVPTVPAPTTSAPPAARHPQTDPAFDFPGFAPPEAEAGY